MKIFFNQNCLSKDPLCFYEKDISNKIEKVNSNGFIGTIDKNSKYYIGSRYTNIRKEWLNLSPTMFLEFSELNIFNKDEFQNFIKRYGFLTSSNYYSNFPLTNEYVFEETKGLTKQKCENIQTIFCEPLALWILFQIEVRRLIRYWRTIEYYQTYNSETLLDLNIYIESKSPLILRDIDDKKYFLFLMNQKNPYGVLDKSLIESDLPENIFDETDVIKYYETRYKGIKSLTPKVPTISKNNIINYMHDFLINELNNKQSEYLLTIETIGQFHKKTKSLMESISMESGNHLIYRNLMGGIISQLAESIANNKKYKRCLECQSWIESSSQGRIGKIYCNNNCRAKAQRRRDSLKILYENNSPDGKLSLKNQINDFCKAFNEGPEKYKIWEKKFEDQLKDKPKSRSLLTNVRLNILNNLRVWARHKSIAEHLDISEDYLKKINTTSAFKVVYSISKHDTSYYDWDMYTEK